MNSEKLNLWDRIFNRYRKVVIDRDYEQWFYRDENGVRIANSEHKREYVRYKIIDRVTGSETIEKEYI